MNQWDQEKNTFSALKVTKDSSETKKGLLRLSVKREPHWFHGISKPLMITSKFLRWSFTSLECCN